MSQVVEEIIMIELESPNKDAIAARVAFFKEDGTPFSFSDVGSGGGVSEDFVNDAIATAIGGLPEGVSEDFVNDAITTALSGLPDYPTEEEVTAAINTAVDGLSVDLAEAVDGLASEIFVSDSIATAVSTTITTLVAAAINALMDGAPDALNTLKELAAAINDDASFAATVTAALATKQPSHANLTALAGLTLTNGYFIGVNGGAIVLRSASQTKSDLSLGSVDNTPDSGKPVSTAQQAALDLKAPIASPIFTGVVTIPTGASITDPTGLDKYDVGLNNVDNTPDSGKPVSTAQQTAINLKESLSNKGIPGGYPELDSNGFVLASNLPSYVDDVVDAANFAALPGTGVSGKIYVTIDDLKTYRWSGSAYAEISASLAIGELSTTAYRGDRGKTAYDHSQTTGNPHGVTKADIGLGSVDNTPDTGKPAATTSAKGIVELAITSEIDTGTDSTRAMPVDQFVASARNIRYILFRVVDSATTNVTGTTIGGDLEFPFAGTITEIGVYVDTAGTTGLMTVDVNKNGTTLMTTSKVTLDSTEKSSRTAATAPVLTTTALAAGDIITVDVDGIQTTPAKGLTLRLGVRQA